ncbi:MAG: QueT transporter family protein [Butyrivibrio sp.]|nr:QueT transporter family protein [Acetatifactor muris]MCM1558208.1 QueT transporter family protein [Butyrivibrio sp.]
MRNKKVLFIVQAAVIAAVYVVLTYFISAFNLASGAIQVRISEALCILPFFTPAAIPGLFLGCLLSNLLTGCIIWDVVFGSLATLLGALGTWLISGRPRQGNSGPSSGKAKWLAPLPPIAANTLIVPFVLYYAYHFPGSVPYFMLTVGMGEIISCGILGFLLLNVLNRYKKYIFIC